MASIDRAVEQVRNAAHALTGSWSDYDALLDLIGDAPYVLLGEASHGTHEFYRERAEITRRLIEEKNFTAVAVEADWPDAYRVNQYVRGRAEDTTAEEALSGFKRFPTWMWRNTVVCDFVEWLRARNALRTDDTRRTGFYGLDLYSLHASIDAVLSYLEKVDPQAAARARARYGCFEDFGQDVQEYGHAASFGLVETCEQDVVNQLVELRRRAGEYTRQDSESTDEYFYAEQNARLVKNAEEYYRVMFRGHIASWNLRDRHMAETFDALIDHLSKRIPRPKLVVWAHNSHLGDARATEMSRRSELNVGQLIREKYGSDAVLVGFSTFSGWVTAASDWDAPAERKRVRPALDGSYEALFHETGLPSFLLTLRGQGSIANALRGPCLERAIGVIYRPQSERISHYFHAQLPSQFDAVMHFDTTTAVEPLERMAQWDLGEPAETYPSGM